MPPSTRPVRSHDRGSLLGFSRPEDRQLDRGLVVLRQERRGVRRDGDRVDVHVGVIVPPGVNPTFQVVVVNFVVAASRDTEGENGRTAKTGFHERVVDRPGVLPRAGSRNSAPVPLNRHQSCTACATNSGPLSKRT